MTQVTAQEQMRQRKLELTKTSSDSAMGKLLRKFWQPVALADSVEKGLAIPLRILGEDLTLYRGDSGSPHLVAAHCAHRRTLLHTGWIEGEQIRCVYHGWKYDANGVCVERPAEGNTGTPCVKIAAYPVKEYCGLIFAFLGQGEPPEFDLPRKDVFERPETVTYARAEKWPCHWFQQVENSLDATHVSFVHQLGVVGPFGAAVTTAIPKLEYKETDAGIEQIATRSQTNVRRSDWTFPNNNHIVVPGLKVNEPWIDIGIWMVPHDDSSTTRFIVYSTPQIGEGAERFFKYFKEFGDYNPTDHHDELFYQRKFPQDPVIQLVSAQDYVATIGQGVIADTANELLGKSDLGVMTLRRIFWRELEALARGEPTKRWRRLDKSVELPKQPGVVEMA